MNSKLAELLANLRSNWKTEAMPRGRLQGGERPDVLIMEDGLPHVIIEGKIGMKPEDAAKRFGTKFSDGTGKPRLVFELKYPENIKDPNELRTAELLYALHRPTDRFPRDGFLNGNVKELAISIQYARIDDVSVRCDPSGLAKKLWNMADVIESISETKLRRITGIIKQPASRQTWGMAALTLSGAFTFHDGAAQVDPDIPLIAGLLQDGTVPQLALLKAWDLILKHDYYPIFSPAREILAEIPVDEARDLINRMIEIRDSIAVRMSERAPDLYGQCFQRVIEDRTRLAAYYTKPESAALVAALTVPDSSVWGRTNTVRNVTVADFACGTGALLLAAYRAITANYEVASGRPMSDMHEHMMENCIIGADVLPVAAHLTASGLSGMFPKKTYKKTRIYIPEHGGAHHRIGSLEWVKGDDKLFKEEIRLTGGGPKKETAAPGNETVSHVLMNPPYTRSKGPGGRDDDADPRQIFTAFDATPEDREKMGERANKLYNGKDMCANKPAGLATFFMDLAHAKLKPDGWLGLVLPMTVATGVNYGKMRKIIAEKYAEVIVISVGGRSKTSFSADTKMGEIILSARKLGRREKPHGSGMFVSLDDAPNTMLEAHVIGKMARKPVAVSRLASGTPGGGTRLKLGGSEIGTALDCPITGMWPAVRVSDYSLLQMMHKLGEGMLHVPRAAGVSFKTLRLGNASIGPSDLQIISGRGRNGQTSYSGPFKRGDYRRSCVYPALWNNHADAQRTMAVQPDSCCEPDMGAEESDIQRIWESASRVHINITTDVTSQSLFASYMDQPAIGGSAWPSILLPKTMERAFVLWCNGTMGVLCRWYISNRQQRGRLRVSRTRLADLLVPNFTRPQMRAMSKAFNRFADKPLDRINRLNRDETRIKIDEAISSILGIETDLGDLRKRFCSEPHISKE